MSTLNKLCNLNLIDNHRMWKYLSILILAVAITARIFQFIFHKDLWLDEAMLSAALYEIDFSDIFFSPLPYTQAVPFGFLAVIKLTCLIFGYSEYSLYFFPLICGIASLILSLKIANKIYGGGGGDCLSCAFVAICAGSLGLIHYSTEFKQYGIEAFVAFLLTYIYVSGKNFKIFSSFSVILIFFSNTIIFIIFGFFCAYLYRNIYNLKIFISKNFLYILVIPFVFIIYYLGYIRYQAVSGFYEYWDNFFLPHDILSYPKFISEVLLDIFVGYTPFGKTRVLPIYIFISILGLYWLYCNYKDIFVACIVILAIAILLSICKIYPFGHGGIIGGRLSLYLSVIFYLLCTCGLAFIIQFCKGIYWRNFWAIFIMFLIIADICRYWQNLYKREYYIQQTHELILRISKDFNSNDCLFVYNGANPAFKYYSFLEGLSLPNRVFSEISDLHIDSKEHVKCRKIFVLSSHSSNELEKDISSSFIDAGYDTLVIKPKKYHGYGTFLIIANNY